MFSALARPRCRLLALLGFAALASPSAGCGGSSHGVALAPVTGTVTYKGAPVGGATVTFTPAAQGVRSGSGTTDDNGKFKLSTFANGDGAPVGKCNVAISKFEPPPPPPPGKGDAYLESMPDGKSLVPKKYTSAMTSGLSVEVLAGKSNDFTFDMTGELPP